MTTATISETPHTTSRPEFDGLLGDHRVLPVVRALYGDSETPVGVYRKLADGRPGSFLLESAGQGGLWSRWSFVGVRSFGVLTQDGDRAAWIDTGIDAERAVGSLDGAPLEVLARLHERWATPRVPGSPPLVGGTVGFIGWEAVRQLEHLPNVPPADFDVPGQALSFVSELAALDHRTGLVLLVASVLNDGTDDADTLWADAQQRLDRMQADLVQPSVATVAEAFEIAEPTADAPHEPGRLHGVRRALEGLHPRR